MPRNRFWMFDVAANLIAFPFLILAFVVDLALKMAGFYPGERDE